MAELLPNEPLPAYPDGLPAWSTAETPEERGARSRADRRRRDAMARLGRVAMADALFLLLSVVVVIFCAVRVATHPAWEGAEQAIAAVLRGDFDAPVQP